MRALASFVATAALFLGLAACKQGEGEYCQINDDCKDGLVCAPTTSTCQAPADVINEDAGIDAQPIDGGLIDAEQPDAAAPDAGPPDAGP